MNRHQISIAAALGVIAAVQLPAQELHLGTAPDVTLSTASAESPATAPRRPTKPTIVVMAFESGTVAAQARDKRGFGAVIAGMRGRGSGENYDPGELGVGIADMLVEKLLESGQFQILERTPSATGSPAQFIVRGSVTKFGFEEHNYGGIAGHMLTLGLLSYNEHKTEVTLTARIVNAATGEIVASISGEGLSKKGGGLRVGGIGGGNLGGVDVSSANFRGTAIGEATERAVSNLAQKIVQNKPVS